MRKSQKNPRDHGSVSLLLIHIHHDKTWSSE